MKPVVFVQIFVINRHADHLGDEHGMAAECAALGDAAGDVDRAFRDSGSADMLNRHGRQTGFRKFIHITAADNAAVVARARQLFGGEIDDKFTGFFDNIVRIP